MIRKRSLTTTALRPPAAGGDAKSKRTTSCRYPVERRRYGAATATHPRKNDHQATQTVDKRHTRRHRPGIALAASLTMRTRSSAPDWPRLYRAMIRLFAIHDVGFDIVRHFIWQSDTEFGNLQRASTAGWFSILSAALLGRPAESSARDPTRRPRRCTDPLRS